MLNYLPFEALLSAAVPHEHTYRHNTFQYLLKAYQISYAYSATLLDKMSSHRLAIKGKLLGFAPAFPEGQNSQSTSVAERSGAFGPLFYNEEEVRSIPFWIAGRRFYKKQATLAHFLEFAPFYRFIHLSTHAKANDAEGTQSILAFSNENGIETCDVNAIYNLHLQADMVVLSACETGLGELQRGEGIIGLTRGFIVAGASSVITTLWSVNDRASADLMQSYYQLLKRENGKTWHSRKQNCN